MRFAVPALILVAITSACVSTEPPTPIVMAARSGDVTTIRTLAAAGTDLNALGRNEWTPMMHAIHKGQTEAVSALIAAGADVNRLTPSGMSALEMAVGNGQTEIVRRLLEAGANPRKRGVFVAAVSGGAFSDIERALLGECHTDIVRALLEKAPDLELPDDEDGYLSMMFASLNRCNEVMQMVRLRRG